MQNADKHIKDLTAFFENEQTYIIIQNGNIINESISINFTESGLKEIAFDITYSDSTYQTTYAKCAIDVTPIDYTGIKQITATKPFQGYDEPSDCDGSCFGQGEYQVFLANESAGLVKPYIVLDGFDPNDKRKILENDETKSIYDLMEYDDIDGDTRNFVSDLNSEGFDKTDKTDTLVISTHGIEKKTQKTPKKEIEKAENLRKQYFNDLKK